MKPEENEIEIEIDNYVSPDAAKLVDDNTAPEIELDLPEERPAPVAPPVSTRTAHAAAVALLGGGINGRAMERALETSTVETALGDIATEAQRNATESSDIAGARNRVVGFDTPQGYADAAALAMDQATRDEYVRRARAGGVEVDVASLPPIVTNDAPVGQGIAHVPSGPSIFDRPRSERAFKVGVVAQVVPDENEGVRLQHGELIAGGAAEGHGIITAWTGKGPMLRPMLVEISDEAQLPREWLPLVAEPAVQLRKAVHHVATERGLEPKKEKAKDRQVVEARKVDSRWMLATRASEGARVGAKYGEIVLVVSLYGQRIEFDEDGDADLREAVRVKYEELTSTQRYDAAEVSRWIDEVFRFHMQGVKYGPAWYVPRKHRAMAERLVSALIGPVATEPRWGTNWMNPPLPIASGNQLAAGLRNGLVSEVDEILHELSLRREKAQEESGASDIGEVARGTFMTRLRRVGLRVAAYGALLGEEQVASCKQRLHEAMVDLERHDSGGFSRERFELIWDEINRDAAREAVTG